MAANPGPRTKENSRNNAAGASKFNLYQPMQNVPQKPMSIKHLKFNLNPPANLQYANAAEEEPEDFQVDEEQADVTNIKSETKSIMKEHNNWKALNEIKNQLSKLEYIFKDLAN